MARLKKFVVTNGDLMTYRDMETQITMTLSQLLLSMAIGIIFGGVGVLLILPKRGL